MSRQRNMENYRRHFQFATHLKRRFYANILRQKSEVALPLSMLKPKNEIMKTIYKFIPIFASFFFILLFIYAAASKMLDFENFQVQLAQSPLLSAYAGFISYGVIGIEIGIAAL